MSNSYRIELGVKLKDNDIQNQINDAQKTLKPIEIKVDTETKELTKSIQDALKSLSTGTKNALTLDTTALEGSLKDVKDAVIDIKNAFGTLDDKSGIKSLLSSVNQISTALDKTSKKFDELVGDLKSLSSKDFSLNLGINIGGSNPIARNSAYGSKVRSETLPQLKQQVAQIEAEVIKHYQKVLKDPTFSQDKVFSKLIGGTPILEKSGIDVYDLYGDMNSTTLKTQIQAYKQYINIMKEAAQIKKIDLSGVTSGFSKTADQLVQDAIDVQTGAKEMDESFDKLKQIFSGGSNLNIQELSVQLDPIIKDLKAIREAVENLSKGVSLDGLTSSFDRLSDSIEKLVQNAAQVKVALGDGLTGVVDVDTGEVKQIEKVSDDVTNAVIQNEKKKQDAYKATTDTVLYHAGVVSKLNKAETNGRFYGSNRGTGYFGTGHYFVDSATKHELDSNGHYNKLPYTSVDISKYDNLFKATTDEVADRLHTFLKNLTAFTQGSDNYDVSELFEQFRKVFGDTIMDVKEFGSRLDQLKAFMSSSSMDDRSDSVSTQFMKSLGYEGVDTRGTRYADTRYGTVIYDLKEESILQANITDELQKQGQMLEKINYAKGQVFDKSEDERIQGILDAQNKRREIEDEFKNSFDTTGLDKAESDLSAAENRLREIDGIISELQRGIDNADQEARKFAKDMEDIGLGYDDQELADYKKRLTENYTNSIDELSQEKAELQSKIPVLEEVYNRENQLANEAYEQAKQVVEQRRLEAQQAQESANDVVQAEERKQQALEETADAVEKISKAKVDNVQSDTLNLKDDITEADRLAAAFSKLKNIQGNMTRIETGKLDVSKSVQEIQILEKQLESLSAEHKETIAEINGMGGVSMTQWQSVQNQINTTKLRLEQLKSSFTKDIELKLATGDFATQIQKVESDAKKLSLSSKNVEDDIKDLNQALKDMRIATSTGDIDGLVSAYKRYEAALKDVNNQLKQNKIAEQSINDLSQLNLKKQGLSLEMSKWLKDNSAAAKQFGGRIKELQSQINACDNTGLDNLKREFQNIKKEAQIAGKTTKTFGDKLKDQFAQYSTYLSIASLFMYAEQGLRSMFEQVKLIDSAMTELKKVTDETDASYNRFLSNAASRAKELGTTIDGLVSSTADFARLGYGFEDSQKLAEVANIYAVVGDDIDSVEQATQSLISTLTAFKKEANGLSDSDFAMSIVDKMNEVANNYAISSGGIGDALQRSASSMMAANNSLDETIALITAANTVVQDPDAIGTAFKTISMRIRGAKTEMEEAGLETDGMADSTAKLREEVMALSGVDIMLNANEFKSTYQIMQELAGKWQDLTDIQQASVTELIAGKRQGNIVSSLMTNFDIAEEALETSLNSAGSAMKEHEKWQQSLEAQINKLKAAWQSLSQSFMSSNFLKGALDVIIGLVDGINWLIDSIGTIPTLLAAFAAFESFKGIGFFKTIEDEASLSGKRITNIFKTSATQITKYFNDMGIKSNSAFKQQLNFDTKALFAYRDALKNGVPITEAYGKYMTNASEAAQKYAKTHDVLTEGVLKFSKQQKASQVTLIAQNKSLSSAKAIMNEYNSGCKNTAMNQKAFIDAVSAGNSGLGRYLSGLNGAKAGMSGYITSLVGAKIASFALEAATMALNAVMSWGLSLAIQGVISGLQFLVRLVFNTSGEIKELAESVDELTSKYKQESDALKKLKGDYDTSNESSMISKYEKLSKGVDNLGRNVSLTSEEYSEYQSIVNKIADQMPSLISGYDAQGNALLSVKGNIEELTEAYQNLIKAQNNEILAKSGDIYKDFDNTVNEFSTGGSVRSNKELLYDEVKLLEGVLKNRYTTEKEIDDYFNKYDGSSQGSSHTHYQAIQNALKSAGVDVGKTFSVAKVQKLLGETVKNDPDKIRTIIESFNANLEKEIDGMQSVAQAVLSNAFEIDDSEYYELSDTLKNLAYQIVNNFDYEFYAGLREKGVGVDTYIKDMLDQFNALSEEDSKQIEAGFDLQTQFNGGDISYGEYVSNLRNIEKTIDGLDLKDEVKNQLKISLGLDENGIVDQYDALLKRLTSKDIGLDDKVAKNFLNSLSAEELDVLVDIIPQLDAGTTLDEIKSMIGERLAEEFKFDITVQTAGIEAFNNALAESRSAAGLTSESISALTARYKDLDGFNAAALFEKTANGIHLNSEELSRLEEQYVSTNKLDIEKNLNTLVTKYNDLTEEIKGCTDAQKKEKLQLQANAYKDKIDELSTLASQYDGLTSAFAKWQTALEGAEEGDNYDSLYENLEGIKELYDAGLVGTDKFKTAVQLMTNKDLANADIDEIVNAYKKGYPKMQRYFTEGQKGCKNFLNDVRKLNSEWAHMNKDGSWEINFNAEEVAKELGVSVDFVLQIAKKLKDYGFEVNLEDSSVDNLKTKIEQTEAKLKKLGQAPVDINVDIEANSKNLGTIESEIEKAKSKIKEINNSSVEPKVKTAQLEDAQAKLEALIDKKIEASQPAFMNLNTSQVNASLVDALEKIQSYQDAINEVNKLSELKEAGITIDDSQLQKAKEKVDECAKAIQGLDGEVKMAIGLEEDGSIDSIKKSFEEGKVKIDANTDPALTKIEQLAENVERIEDKDVTINVTVNGLDKVKELNKQIDLATDIDGDIDKLSEYVKNAKSLSELSDNITTYVTADINGNVTKTKEKNIKKLETFANSIEGLKDVGSFTTSVKADVSGNVIDTKESKLDNLKVFTDSAKDIEKIGTVTSTVTADIKGNVADTKEYKINNLKVFTDNAKDISKIGVVESKVKADIEGNVINTKESKLNNLKVFTDNAKDIRSIGNVESKVFANIDGNVTDTREGKLDNLKVFTDNAKDIRKIGNAKSTVDANISGNVIDTSEDKLDNIKVFTDNAKDIQKIGNVESKVNANINGNVIDTREGKLDNLKVFTNSAKDIAKIGDAKSTVTAEIKGNVIDTRENKLDNIKVFTDSAKDIRSIGNVSSKVTAEVDGNVIDTKERKIDNIKVFTDSAKDLKSVGTVKSSVNADIHGNVIDTKERKLDNLEVFAKGAKEIKNIGTVTSDVAANIDGNVIGTREGKLDNLGVFADNVKDLKGVGSFKSEIVANIDGNVIDTGEEKLDNLKVFYDSAKNLKDIGDVNSTVKANVEGNVINTKERKIDNLEVFSNSAKDLKKIGDVTSKVSANVNGNVIDTKENKLDNLKVFYDSAKNISKIGTVKSSVNASISGNVIDTREGKINNLKVFYDSAKNVKSIGSPTSNVTANVYGNVINTKENKIDNLGVFATNANKLKNTGNFTSSVSANVSGNVITDDSVNSDLERFASIVSGMTNKTVSVSVTAKVDSDNVNAAIDLLKKVSDSGVFKDYKATVQVGAKIATIDDTTVKNYKAPPKDGKVKYSVDPTSSVFTWTAPPKDGVVNYSAEVEALTNGQKHKTGTITYTPRIKGGLFGGVAQGTAHSSGSTSGRAFAQGNWGIKGSGVALGGELGTEVVVRNGKWFTVGDAGAEFFHYKKNDIVFNAAQTESLFKYGGIKGANPRGKMLATGTAFAEGNAFVTGGGKFRNSITGESYGSTSKEKDKDFEEVLDWIEVIINRVERSIDKFEQQTNNIYKSWSSRNTALQNQISEISKEIGLQQQAKSKYMSAANGVGLSESWAKKVRNGEIDIDTIKDEDLAEKIKSYQDYYNKALDCEDAVRELQETEASLYAQRFENIQTQYDSILQGYEHTEAMLNEYISQAEAQGHIVSKKYYDALVENEKSNISELKKEQSDLIAERDKAVADGKIAKYSEEWYNMCQEIDDVTQAIEEGTTALIEYDNAIRDIDWQVFDLIQERISDIAAESEFLIELMSNRDLFDDNGKFTERGVATVGLHALNYNTSMYRADEYGKEIANLDKQIAKDPYDQELINRRRELVELQRESVLAAEDEKSAIKDLVEEGINLELDALQERIDLHNEELDSMKDLYDYQKNVEEQTKNIASLRKQLGAYEGVNDEETRAKVQELKVSLEEAEADLFETEYDRFISDQTALLDTLYTDYETVLNTRLDNIDLLLEQVIEGINVAAGAEGTITSALGANGAIAAALGNNATTIGETLKNEVGAVGTKLSTAMSSIWTADGTGKAVIDLYGKDFQSKHTTTNEALNKIKADVAAMVDDVDKDAQKKVTANQTTTSAQKNPTTNTSTTNKPTTNTNTNKPTSSGDGRAKVGDKVKFVSGKYYYDSQGKKPLGAKNLGKQVYITKINTEKWATHPYHISTGSKLGSGDLGWLKLNQLSGYATGKKKISNSEYAWTQENGQEFIVRPSDGAILTPVAKGDSVLNATATGNIWQMANNPAEFIKNNLGLDSTNIPNGANINNHCVQNFENINFNMPNVHSYNELIAEMQRDPKFEKLILAMTVDQIAGKSKLGKNKAIR